MIRKAHVSDIKAVHKLVNDFSKKQIMIARSLTELYENVRDMIVFEEEGRVIGVCALHILWEDLAEIRSLAVIKEFQGKGVGRSLVKRCLKEAKALGIEKVFTLTYQPGFFEKLGFGVTDKSLLPQKIWGDCVRCPKFPECDETALIIELKTN